MIKRYLLLLLTVSLGVLFSHAQNTETKPKYLIEQGTVIKVKALERVRSNKIEEGEEVQFEVFEPLEISGKTLIKEGTIVRAFIESVEKARSLGKEGYLKIEFVNTTAVDGSKVPLRALRGSITGEDKTENSLALTVFLSPAFLLKRGGQAKINEGKVMRVNVTRDVYVNVN